MGIWDKDWNARFHDKGGTKVSFAHRDFGLAMDGIVDDTEAAQEAIDWVKDQGGGQLYIPPSRVFKITDTLVLPRTSVVDILGCGQRSRIIHAGTGPAIKFSDDAQNVVSWFHLSNFKIEFGEGASGILINNSRAEEALTGTVTVTNGSRNVNGAGTLFNTEIDITRDGLVIDGVEYEIRSNGVRGNTLVELRYPYPGATASGLAMSRARYGNGGRWGEVEKLWLQGVGGAGTYGIKAERINNVTFDRILIRNAETGFMGLALNGRSAGCWMSKVIVANADTVAFDFNDCRAFAMKRCRSEGNVPIAFRFDTCEAMQLDFCTAEDDHETAGFQMISCDRMEGYKCSIGTNFGGGVGFNLQNVDSSTFWGGHAAYQALRPVDWPTTPDTIVPGISINSSCAGVRFTRFGLENGTAALANSSTSSTVEWLDLDKGEPALYAEAIPILAKIKTNAGAALTTAQALSKFDGGAVRVNADGGAFTLTLPNASAENIGLRFIFLGEGAADNSVTITRAATDTIDGATSITIRRSIAHEIICTEPGKWMTIRRTSTRVAGTSTGVGSIRMNNGTAAQNVGWLEVAPSRWVPTWTTPTP